LNAYVRQVNNLFEQDCYAYTNSFNDRFYRENGVYHRLNGPAIEWGNGDKYWMIYGNCHRLDGPAIERVNGQKEWWVDGKRHRLDGPAVEDVDGYKAWWVDGKEYQTQQEHALAVFLWMNEYERT
jgi:hypothetical protein